MDNYTVLLATLNEERRIEFVLRNFSGRAPVLVLDGGSTDGTLEVAARYNCRAIRRPHGSNVYLDASARAWMLEQVPTEYVFIAYCSFFVPRGLLRTFGEVSRQGKYRAVRHDYQSITYGRYIQKPLVRRRAGACHFFARGAIDLGREKIHSEWPLAVPESQVLTLPATDELAIHVFRDYDSRSTELKHSGYADIEALERFGRGERTSAGRMLGRAAREFLSGFVRGGGFRAGVPGLLYHAWRAEMAFNIQARIWEHQNGMRRDETSLLHAKMRDRLLREIEGR